MKTMQSSSPPQAMVACDRARSVCAGNSQHSNNLLYKSYVRLSNKKLLHNTHVNCVEQRNNHMIETIRQEVSHVIHRINSQRLPSIGIVYVTITYTCIR